MDRRWKNTLIGVVIRQRRAMRESEAAFILLAAIAGLAAGVLTNFQQFISHGLQRFFYGVTINRLSALGSIHHPWRLLALPAGGLAMMLIAFALRGRSRPPIDVVEANALHGGRIPFVDNLVVAGQTIISNGTGASVGLEAAYAQMGGGVASLFGQWLKLRRNDLRTLVGAGAGAAVGAAFGAPLTGAFYAFEIVIGNYTPAAIAPVVVAALVATFVTRGLGVEPYLIATTANRVLTILDYLAYAGLGLVCALIGIGIMRLVTSAELRVQAWDRISPWKPFIGGILLIPIVWLSPQSLSAGHGALHLDLLLRPTIAFLTTILVLKIAASVISLSFGFRGGLFFASLFLGSLIGQIFADLVNVSPLATTLNVNDAALVGMAALSVSIIGGPMTLAILILETTHDFALMGVVLTATLVSSAVTRETFGYSFSTWRMHVRGSAIRSPRDIGWILSLSADRMMRKDWVAVSKTMTAAQFRIKVPLGSTSKAVMIDAQGRYCGIIPTASAYRSDLDGDTPIKELAIFANVTLSAGTGIKDILEMFDAHAADELAVVGPAGHMLGMVSETYARRRYLEEIEASQRALFGET